MLATPKPDEMESQQTKDNAANIYWAEYQKGTVNDCFE